MQIRDAKPEDAMAVAQVHVRSWQVGYRGLLPKAYLDQLRAEERAERYDFAHADPGLPHTCVAEEAGRIVGFASAGPSRDPALPNYGELFALYVDPEYWGRGIGVALVTNARKRLLASGFCDAALWVLQGNGRAERFYQSDGWAPDGEQKTDTIWGVTVEEVRYRRRLTGDVL
jgi:GNAT superfamily N-acetyltransferase